jgi:hypothetical protein
VSFHGDYALVSELEGRVTILDRDNTPVAFLGDNPQKTQWANYQLPPSEIAPAFFQRRTDATSTIKPTSMSPTGIARGV